MQASRPGRSLARATVNLMEGGLKRAALFYDFAFHAPSIQGLPIKTEVASR